MESEVYDLERAFWRAAGTVPSADLSAEDLWPTESKGNGKIVKNNLRTGAAQGKAQIIRKAHCQLCGFPNDMTSVDHSGGSLDGEGAGGQITSTLVSAPVTGGAIHTEYVGTQAYRTASGCALCFSKNSTLQRINLDMEPNPWDRIQPLGF